MIASSDWHIRPGQSRELELKRFLAHDALKIINGDLLNILPYGLTQWRTEEGKATLDELKGLINNSPNVTVWLKGNHEGRLSWMKQLLGDCPHLIIDRSYDTGAQGRHWHFEHGHKFTDWWLLRHVADDIVEIATTNRVVRPFWYALCKRLDWMPGSYPPNPHVHELIGLYWANVLRAAIKAKCTYVVGHSHQACHLETGFGYDVIDCGCRETVAITGFAIREN